MCVCEDSKWISVHELHGLFVSPANVFLLQPWLYVGPEAVTDTPGKWNLSDRIALLTDWAQIYSGLISDSIHTFRPQPELGCPPQATRSIYTQGKHGFQASKLSKLLS